MTNCTRQHLRHHRYNKEVRVVKILQDGASQDECVGWSCRKVLGDTGSDIRVPHRKDERKAKAEEKRATKVVSEESGTSLGHIAQHRQRQMQQAK
eukprot:scaffold23709_cov86-Skeletonema_dohrnii-CCMP3373.AAC.5